MTYQEACHLRDEIRETGIMCVVPKGRKDYQPEIHGINGRQGFSNRKEWLAYLDGMKKRAARIGKQRPSSPIELLIDKACGIEFYESDLP